MINALIAALHFLSAFGMVATVVAEWTSFSRTPTLAEARRIQICDTFYGLFATVVLVAGLLRVFYFEKGSRFYLSNPVFITKLVLFIGVGLLSIYPTIRFLRWRQATRVGQAPTMSASEFNMILRCLRLEVILLVGVIVSASFMAKGVGL